MTTKSTRCLELGVCQGLGADKCPDCDSWDCEIPMSELARPTFPFAPGVIQGPKEPRVYMDVDGPWIAFTKWDMVAFFVFVAVLSFVFGYLVVHRSYLVEHYLALLDYFHE